MTRLSIREFNCDVSTAKREAGRVPVVITDRRKIVSMLLSIEEYWRAGNGERHWLTDSGLGWTRSY